MEFSPPESAFHETKTSLEEQLKAFEQILYVLRHETYELCHQRFQILSQDDDIDISGDSAPEGTMVVTKTDQSELVGYGLETPTKADINAPTLLCIEASVVQRNITIHKTIDWMRNAISSITPVALVRENLSHSLLLGDINGYQHDPKGYETLLENLALQQVPHIEITNLTADEILQQCIAFH